MLIDFRISKRLISCFIFLLIIIPAFTAASEKISPEECFDCHSDPEIITEVDPPRRGLFVPEKKFYNSVHGKESCVGCHRDADPDHDENLKPAECKPCHKRAAKGYYAGLHYAAVKKKDPYAPSCVTCHGKHAMRSSKDPASPTYPMNIPLTCGKCHKEGSEMIKHHDISKHNMVEQYSMSIHGKGLFESGLKVTAVCVSCHMSHEIRNHADPRSSINRKNISKTCMQCHAAIEQVHKKVIKGKLWKQSHKLPVCIECHAPHKIKTEVQGKKVPSFEDAYCMSCHADSQLSVTKDDGSVKYLYINKEHFSGSAHEDLQCVKCHVDVNLSHTPVCEETKKVDCSSCHEEPAKLFKAGVHGKLFLAGDPDAPDCITCHGTHDIHLKTTKHSPIARANIPKLCSKCHKDGNKAAIRIKDQDHNGMVEKYNMSIHGKALEQSGLLVTAVCSDCHTAHMELPHTDSLSTVHPNNISHTCAKCHEGIYDKYRLSIHSPEFNPDAKEKLPACNDCHSSHTIKRVSNLDFRQEMVSQCGHCHEKLTETYFETYHGKSFNLGYAKSAKCADCHGSHNILPPHDSLSTLSSSNIVQTCSKCHPEATKKFTGYLTHATHNDRETYPMLFYTFWGMTALLLGTFLFFGIHTLLWFPRSFKERM
ncbi:MAG: hypothetical protein HQK83_10720, partial [Fibrobacteria bacterium]|nr:hypothetical protein [Fibrobacteria bacterium]